jgi:hypothetical protein
MSVKSEIRKRKAASLANKKSRLKKPETDESATHDLFSVGPKKRGRPLTDFKLQEAARSKAPEALKTIVRIMLHSLDEGTRIAAAKIILERGYGKAVQAIVSADITPVQPQTVSTPEQAAELYLRMMGNSAVDLSAVTWAAPMAVASIVAEVPAAPAVLPDTPSNVIQLREPK